jgi:CheY-like chemotaxis protein
VNASHPAILVVDDDADIREALIDILEDHGYRTRAAANGREALDALRGGLQPDVILLDLMMPVMDGAQFRREQLNDPQLRDYPVVVISAGNDLDQHATSLGIAERLRKPLDLERLLEMLERHARPGH